MFRIVSDQIADYPRVHRDRRNLCIHIFAVPMFWAGIVSLAIAVVKLNALDAIAGAVLLIVSIALQAWGHAQEGERPAPFKSPLEFPIRITTENLYVFPRYVLTGGWARAWRGEASR